MTGSATGSVIVSGARTPMGRLLGAFAGFPATKLGGSRSRPRWSGPGWPRTRCST